MSNTLNYVSQETKFRLRAVTWAAILLSVLQIPAYFFRLGIIYILESLPFVSRSSMGGINLHGFGSALILLPSLIVCGLGLILILFARKRTTRAEFVIMGIMVAMAVSWLVIRLLAGVAEHTNFLHFGIPFW